MQKDRLTTNQGKHSLIGGRNVSSKSISQQLSITTTDKCDSSSSDPEQSSVDAQTQQLPSLGCFLPPSALEWSSQTRSHTDDQVFETEYETAGAGTCSRQPPQNAGLGSS